MEVNSLKLDTPAVKQIAHLISPPPQQLYWAGIPLDDVLARPKVAIVGSRKASPYGRTVTFEIAGRLARSGVVIISGLAFGIDSFAHKAALDVGGCTVAVLPTPLQKISPASHHSLAEQILRGGGALVSEYGTNAEIRRENFIARNRIVSALADVLLITEAAKNSGSLHTARFALEQGKTVMAVPGNINSPTSEGCNNLIKSGAVPACDANDVFFALGIKSQTARRVTVFAGTPDQQMIFDLINQGVKDQEELAQRCKMNGSEISSTLTILELQGYIKPSGAGTWTAA